MAKRLFAGSDIVAALELSDTDEDEVSQVCKHGYCRYQCGKCDPLPLAAEVMQELIDSAEALHRVRGHSPQCGNTCYCGAALDKQKAEGRLSWAVASAHEWAKTFKQKRITSKTHSF